LYTPFNVNGAHLTRKDIETFAGQVGMETETGTEMVESWDFGRMVVEVEDDE
jgi:hypothetical protein